MRGRVFRGGTYLRHCGLWRWRKERGDEILFVAVEA